MVCVKIVLETKECTTNYVKSDKAVLKSKKTCKGKGKKKKKVIVHSYVRTHVDSRVLVLA